MGQPESPLGFEIIEHTADVGIRSWGKTAAACLEQAARGLFEIVGVWRPDAAGSPVAVTSTGRDRAAVVVEWLNEVLYEYEARDAVASRVQVDEVAATSASGTVWLAPRGDVAAEGTQVKAVTYHRLEMQESGDGWAAQIYVDV